MKAETYRVFLQDLFADLGSVETRPMFGVGGLFCDGTIFAVIADERVFLKTDETRRGDFLSEGTAPFVYRVRNGDEVVTSYYELPARLFDDPDEALLSARRAYAIALRSPASLRRQRKQSKRGNRPAVAHAHDRSFQTRAAH